MSKRGSLLSGARVRRGVQVFFLLVFSGLILLARPESAPSPWLESFFLVDPLILLATWLAAHAVPQAMLLGLGVVAITVIAGRVFCG